MANCEWRNSIERLPNVSVDESLSSVVVRKYYCYAFMRMATVR